MESVSLPLEAVVPSPGRPKVAHSTAFDHSGTGARTPTRRQHGQSAVFGGAELTKPASSHGSVWLPPALHSLEEPRSHSACPERLWCRRQAVTKSRI